MALNLWKIGGKPTSFNPLVSTYISAGIGDYVVSCRAKSNSGAVLNIYDTASYSYHRTTLNSNYQNISFTISLKQDGMFIWIKDDNSNNDIVIDSISIVRAPLSKLTVNGVDGFKSGKWVVPANATVIDDQTLQVNAGSNATLDIPCLPNTTYSFGASSGLSGCLVRSMVNTSTIAATHGAYPFTTPSNAVFIRVYLQPTNTFKNVQLNLGSTLVPYSLKTGDKMCLPVAKKNLFAGFKTSTLTSGISGVFTQVSDTQLLFNPDILTRNGYYRLPVQPNTNYTVSFGVVSNTANNGQIGIFTDDTVSAIQFYTNSAFTFNSGSRSIVRVYLRNSIAIEQITFSNLQVEPGTTATPYTPYAVQVNKLPQKYVPKKNLISLGNMTPNNFISDTTGALTSSASGTSATDYLFINANTVYTLSGVPNGAAATQRFAFYDANKTFISGFNTVTQPYTFTSPSNAKYFRLGINPNDTNTVQLELGSTATPFEAYQLVLPKANKGISLNPTGGLTDYITAPFQSYVSLNGNFQIDGSFKIDKLPSGGNAYSLIQNSNGTSDRIALFVNPGGQFGMSYYNGTSWTGISTSIACPVGQDVNFTASYNSGVLKLIVNGVNQTGNGTGYAGNINTYLYIGQPTTNQSTNTFSGTIYSLKVTNLTTGQIGLNYDFTNTKNIVGNTVIPNAQNLIPNFEDSGWNLHANAKVLGKNVLHLDATAAIQSSQFIFNNLVVGNVYMLYLAKSIAGIRMGLQCKDINGNVISESILNDGGTFTTPPIPSGTVTGRLYLTNYSGVGGYDFIRPQLFQLSGQEGTINGSPVQKNKTRKRLLYAKR